MRQSREDSVTKPRKSDMDVSKDPDEFDDAVNKPDQFNFNT